MIRTAGRGFPTLVFHVEDADEGVCFIGKVLGVD